ncbi:magnesium-translocating P-type ATPase family protein [Dactylonectria macrodidyma]|uniref:Magnesium-transporting ATPase, P-type 1 n=1 Tax=Dactylonectria macrodidyma TaxID=307937 RepID=A0A9P9E4J3_9HYPO|nr:magnesium-translocating P-type ATPase family protein [Dactylonectria macrodidyma]
MSFLMKILFWRKKRARSFQRNYGWNTCPPSAVNKSTRAILQTFAAMPIDKAISWLQTNQNGLTELEAEIRRIMKGENVISAKQAPSWIHSLLEAILNPFNFLLICLAIFQSAVPDGEWTGAAFLIAMVLISVMIRFWQDYRGRVAVFRLCTSVANRVKVRRPISPDNGIGHVIKEVLDNELVPGDIILLPPGSVVPADSLILESSFLRVSQSSWTGENAPAAKVANPDGGEDENLLDLMNIVLAGTSVVSGNGLALVLRTGPDVLIAKMANQVDAMRKKNTFQQGISNMSWVLIILVFIMVPTVLGISGHTTGDWRHAALFSLSFAIGLVPEMLPAILNGNLARGAYKLSKFKVIAKRLDAVQRLGAMSILCCDKTGTLTKDDITMCEYLDCSGATSPSVLELAVLDAQAQGPNGNSIDAAILQRKFRPEEKSTANEPRKTILTIPFTFERRRSGCVVKRSTGHASLIVKGAFDEVLGICSEARRGAKVVPLDAEQKAKLAQKVDELSKDGYRVLLIAEKRVENFRLDDQLGLVAVESNMTLAGMMTFIDPPKEDAAESIMHLKKCGVEVKILTGDSMFVALNVCQKLGVLAAKDGAEDQIQVITGAELQRIYEHGEAIHEIVKSCTIFAKMTPDQKAMVVSTLRSAGTCVGMLGDGINDCVALREADVGIAVDSGASAAKDCADVVLTEKGLGAVAAAVTAGRVTYGNTIKYVKMAVSCNIGNVVSILIASAWLPFLPMTSTQMLMQDLLWVGSQVGIPWDTVDAEYLQVPRDWNTLDLFRFVLIVGTSTAVVNVSTFILGWFYYGVKTAADLQDVKMFQTHYFIQGLLTQILLIHLIRTAKIPFFQSRAKLPLTLLTIAMCALGFAIPWSHDMQAAMGFARPADNFTAFLAAQLVFYCLELQIVKWAYVRLFKTWL